MLWLSSTSRMRLAIPAVPPRGKHQSQSGKGGRPKSRWTFTNEDHLTRYEARVAHRQAGGPRQAGTVVQCQTPVLRETHGDGTAPSHVGLRGHPAGAQQEG